MPTNTDRGSTTCILAGILFFSVLACWRGLPVAQAASLMPSSPSSAAASITSISRDDLTADRDADLRLLMKTLLLYLRDTMQSSNKVPSASRRLALLQQSQQLASLRPHHNHGNSNSPTAEDATLLLIPAAAAAAGAPSSPDFEDPDRMDFHDSDKRQFDDYGHMRFGKRAQQQRFDDYGHMRFGRSLGKSSAASSSADGIVDINNKDDSSNNKH